jgi:hypothetical protein
MTKKTKRTRGCGKKKRRGGMPAYDTTDMGMNDSMRAPPINLESMFGWEGRHRNKMPAVMPTVKPFQAMPPRANTFEKDAIERARRLAGFGKKRVPKRKRRSQKKR